MLGITDLKKGTLITLNGQPFRVTEYNQKQLGRGGSIVNVKLKNLRDGSSISKTFKGSDRIEPARLEPVAAQFLYADADAVHLMRSDNYDQVAIPRGTVGEGADFLTDGLELKLFYINGAPLQVELPTKVELKVVEAEPGIKGDSAGNVLKSCVLETGRSLQVPLFIKAGDKVRVNTVTGEYVERA